MKITFIYTDYGQYNQNNFNRGVAILSACLKQNGHQTSLIHISRRIKKEAFLAAVREKKPDLLAFSFISNMFAQIKLFSLWAKETRIRAVHGGMHPTVAPEECLQQDGINIIVRGEGELALIDLCRALESGKSINDIPNVWIKEAYSIRRNPIRPLIENLDTLPYPDYGLFDYENLEEGFIHKIFVTQASRGCNYGCTYCCNPFLRSLYVNSEKFLRYYSVDRLLNEIEAGLKKYPFLKEIRFYDDTLTQNKDWFRDFVVKYKERINLPYSGNERVENIDEETVLSLKESGCVSLDLGIESGNQFIREKYMHRRTSNEQIIEAFRLLRRGGIRANSFNILGMVGETAKTALDTIKLNAAVSPRIVFNSYFYPFCGTQAGELVRERRYIVDEGVSSFFERPVVRLDTIKKSQLVFFYKYFFFLMRAYGFLFRRCKNEIASPSARNDTTCACIRLEKILDKTITAKYFPSAIFNFLHIGKDDLLIFLRKHPLLYLALRRLYRACRKEK